MTDSPRAPVLAPSIYVKIRKALAAEIDVALGVDLDLSAFNLSTPGVVSASPLSELSVGIALLDFLVRSNPAIGSSAIKIRTRLARVLSSDPIVSDVRPSRKRLAERRRRLIRRIEHLQAELLAVDAELSRNAVSDA